MKVATVCSGIGSPEQALVNLGIEHEIAFACEIDKYARQTYMANFDPAFMVPDMTKETWEGEKFYADLFIGGIPCQAFSLAGKRLGELDPRGLLFYDFYRYVQVQQPKYFIIENVKGLLSDDNGKTFRNWIQLLGRSENTHVNMFNHPDSLEYNLHWKVLNSKDFGVPQNRERVFLVGIRKDLPNTFRFPIGWRLDKRLKDILEPEVDEKYYLSEKMLAGFVQNGQGGKAGFINQDTQASAVFDTGELSPTVCAGTHGYAMGYIKEPAEIIKAGQLSGSHESSGRVYSDEGLAPTVTAKQGGGHEPYVRVKAGRITGRNPDNPKSRKSGLPTEQMLEVNENSDITNTVTTVQKDNVVIEPRINQRARGRNKGGLHEICPTISANSFQDNNHVVGSHRIRRLTPLECFRLQGFPDHYIKPCSDSQTYKQAGNSITVNVMQAILKNLLL